ncbi:MAG: discoidin domain-containing protein [Bacteroidales bacterium]|nr:discoidin domain-containing protein [Bacteroidales bacterium]
MKKLFLLIAAFMFVASNIFAQEGEKLSGTLTTNMSHYSSYIESYPITNANDGSYTTKFWSDGGPSAGDYVTMELASVSSIGDVKFHFESGDKPEHATVEISYDNSEWEPIATITLADISGDNTFSCNAGGLLAQYVRLRFTEEQGNWFQMQEFEVYEDPVVLAERTISVSVNDAAMGSAYIGEEGITEVTGQTKSVKMTAVPAEGFKFINWTLNGEEVSTSVSYADRTEGDKAYVANFAAKEVYQVSVVVNDAIMGTAVATVEGSVYEGTEITLVATPADGYEFVNWTVGEEVIGDETTIVTVVNATTEYKANFKVTPTKLAVSKVTTSMSFSAYYDINDLVDGDYTSYLYSSASAGSSVTLELAEESMVGDIKLYFPTYAYYIPEEAKIQFSSDNVTWTDVEGCSFVNEDVKKDPKTGYNFIALDAKASTAKYVKLTYVALPAYGSFYMNEIELYEASIEVAARTISVSVNDAAMGSAYVGVEGTTELADQTGGVKLVAVANEGYEFINWTLEGEVVSTNAVIVDKTEGDKAYVANFIALAKYTLSVSVNDAIMGTVEASQTGEMFKYTEVTLIATPTEGYEFVNWTVNGEEVSKLSTIIVSVEEDVEYKANFQIIPTKLALVEAEVSMDYYSSYVAANIIDGKYDTMYDSSRKQDYDNNDAYATVTLEEESLIGDVKIYFSGNYRPAKAKIQVSTDGAEWIDVEGSEFAGSDAIDASAVQSGAKLITVNCNGVSAKYVRMFITEKASAYLTMFEFEVYEAPVNVEARTISVSVNDATMGEAYIGISGVTTLEGQTGAVKMFAVASDNAYRFVNWTVNGEEVATSASFVDRTEGDKAYVANFEAKPIYTVGVSSINEEKGTASSDAAEVVYEGDVITFTATPADGYKFTAWTNGTDTVSVANPYTVAITESMALVANFDRDPLLDRSNWTITASSEETSGEGVGNGVATCIIDGKTNTHWHSAWKESSPAYPHWFLIDMKESKAFDAFEYVSRGAGTSTDDSNNNGNIVNYTLYTSDTEIDPEALENATLVTQGQFTYDGVNKVHKVEFNSVKGRYVMLYATGVSANGGKHASCVEFYLYSSAFAVSVVSSNPEIGTAYIGEEGVTSVGCSVEGTDVVTLTAVAAPKYQFVNWTLNGEVVSTDAVYTTDLVTESRAYVANFEFAPVAPRTITATVNNTAKGSVVFLAPESTEASVVSDNIVVIKAVPATSNDFFVNWTIDGKVVGTEATYEYLDAEAVTIQANFESRYEVIVNQVSGGTISVKSGGVALASGDRVLEGNYIAISVNENNRSELKKLFVNGEDVFLKWKYNPDYCVQVTSTITITAEYGEPRCIFTWEATGNGWIEAWEYDTYDESAEEEGTLELPVSPDGEQYAYGEEVPFLGTLAIFARPGEGETLLSLTINGDEVDMSEDGDFMYYGDYFFDSVESAIHVVAEFTGTYTGVENAETAATKVYAVAGGIAVEVAEAANVQVYTIAGTLVSEQTVSEKATIAMTQGVYIVKVADKVSKVIVK